MSTKPWVIAVMLFLGLVAFVMLLAGVLHAVRQHEKEEAAMVAQREINALRDAVTQQQVAAAAADAVTCERAARDVEADPVDVANALLRDLATEYATATGACE